LYEPLFRYEKIKNHEYVIDISLLTNQWFMINCLKQYNKFKEYLNFDYNIIIYPNTYYDNSFIFDLVIPNEYFLQQLMQDDDDSFIRMVLISIPHNCMLFNLNKYNYITNEILELFYIHNDISLSFEIFEYLYFSNEKPLQKIFSHPENLSLIHYILLNNCRDINILEYCVNIIKKNNVILQQPFSIKFPPLFPLQIVNKYINGLYEKNKYYLHCKDEHIEFVFNSFFSDNLIEHCFKLNNFNNFLQFLLRYEIPNHKVEYSIIDNKTENNENKVKIIPIYYSYKNEFKYSNNKNNCSVEHLYNLPFVKKYLRNYQEIQNILDNPDYIGNLNLNTNIYEENILIKLTYIVSLIHNKYNSFIIKFLLHSYKTMGIHYRYNKLTYTDISEYNYKSGYKTLNMFKVLSKTPNKQFNKYIDF